MTRLQSNRRNCYLGNHSCILAQSWRYDAAAGGFGALEWDTVTATMQPTSHVTESYWCTIPLTGSKGGVTFGLGIIKLRKTSVCGCSSDEHLIMDCGRYRRYRPLCTPRLREIWGSEGLSSYRVRICGSRTRTPGLIWGGWALSLCTTPVAPTFLSSGGCHLRHSLNAGACVTAARTRPWQVVVFHTIRCDLLQPIVGELQFGALHISTMCFVHG